jgi:hypothetical protein
MLRRAALLAVLAVSTLRGQSTRRATDERAVRAVVDSFFSAAEREQWDSAAKFVDTTEFAVYVRRQVRNSRSAIPRRRTTVEELMARDTTMPRAVAEWELKQYDVSAAGNDPFPILRYQFGVNSPQELSQLTTSRALARWIAAKDMRMRIREALKRAGCADSVLAKIPFERRAVHAVGFDGDTTAYVISLREARQATDPSFPDELVLVLHARGRTWRLEAREQMLNPFTGGIGVTEGECK